MTRAFAITGTTHTWSLPPRWNTSWGSQEACPTKRFHPVHQQGELVGDATKFEQNKWMSFMFMPRTLPRNSKCKNLDKSNLLILSTFLSLVGLTSLWPMYILYLYISSFCRVQYIILFSLQFVDLLEFRLWRWNMTFLKMKELDRNT